MSSHVYRTLHEGRAVRIQAGWDRPMQQYYLIVELVEPTAADSDADEEGYLYSNLADAGASGCRDFAYFERRLTDLGLQVPPALLEAVRADCAGNVSNRDVIYPAAHR